MYKLIELHGSSNLKIIGTDKCDIKLFDELEKIHLQDFPKGTVILLSPLLGSSFTKIDQHISDYNNFSFIVNDIGTLEYLVNIKGVKSIFLGRILLYTLTRSFDNIDYFLEKFKDYNIHGIFINFEDFFFFDEKCLSGLKEKKIKIGIYIKENMIAYSPRCHYMIQKKEKGDFTEMKCNMYCEGIKKESGILLGTGQEYIYDYKMLLMKNKDFSKLKENGQRTKYIDYFVYES